MFASLRLGRLGRWPRLLLAGACLLLALLSATGAARQHPPATATAPVVVAARDLPAGTTLTARDLAVARWPGELQPTGARGDPAGLLGRRLAGPVAAREPLTPQRLVGNALTRGLGAELVAAPVVLDDPHAADLVHAGDRVTVLATPRAPDVPDVTPPTTTKVAIVAEHALALAVLPADEQAAAEIVLAVDESTAVRLTRDRPAQMFTLVVDPP